MTDSTNDQADDNTPCVTIQVDLPPKTDLKWAFDYQSRNRSTPEPTAILPNRIVTKISDLTKGMDILCSDQRRRVFLDCVGNLFTYEYLGRVISIEKHNAQRAWFPATVMATRQ